MAWFSVTAKNGSAWAFDPEGAAQVIRTSIYNRQLRLRSKTTRHSFSVFGPTLMQVDTDFSGFRAEVNALAAAGAGKIKTDFQEDPAALFEWLVKVRADGELAGAELHKMRREATDGSARELEKDIDDWQNLMTVAKFFRDVSAGALLVGATILSGGALAAALAGGASLTFVGNLQDNIEARQSLKQAAGNAAIATTITVITNVVIPRAGSAFAMSRATAKVAVQEGGKAVIKTGSDFSLGENIALGLVSAAGNTAGDVAKTALTSDYAVGQFGDAAREGLLRQAGGRAAYELPSALLQAVLLSKAIPAKVILQGKPVDHWGPGALGGTLNAVGDRVVAELVKREAAKVPYDLDMVLTEIIGLATAEEYVRRTAMAPLPRGWPGPIPFKP